MDFPLHLGSAICLSHFALSLCVLRAATMADDLCREDRELLGGVAY